MPRLILRAVSCCCSCLFICSGCNNFLNLQQSASQVCECVCSLTKAKGHAAQSSDNNYGIRYYTYFLVIKFTAATTDAPFALIHSLSLFLSHSLRSGKWVVKVARCCNHFNMHRKSQTKQRKMATKPLQQLEASGQLPPPLPSLLPPQSQSRMQRVGCSRLASRASDASLAAKRRKQCRAQEKEIKTWAHLNKKCASHKRYNFFNTPQSRGVLICREVESLQRKKAHT